MSRNKYPEETVAKILEISMRLFLEKGYDNTTIQDIVDELGLSKGAIYHHFKSKEAIMDCISTRYYDDLDWFRAVREDPGKTGLEKLQMFLLCQLTDRTKLDIDHITIPMLENPRILALVLRSAVEEGAPMICSLLEEGMGDGSLSVKQPRELSEALLVLTNMWLAVFASDPTDFRAKVLFLKDMTDRLGLPLIDDHLLSAFEQYYKGVFL